MKLIWYYLPLVTRSFRAQQAEAPIRNFKVFTLDKSKLSHQENVNFDILIFNNLQASNKLLNSNVLLVKASLNLSELLLYLS